MPANKITYVDGVDVIYAEWVNQIETTVHDVLDDASTPEEARTALDVPSTSHTHTLAQITDKGDFEGKDRGASLREDGGEINVDIQGQTAEASPTTEEFLVRRPGDGSYRRVAINNLPTGGGGEVNTATNEGVSGVGVFKQKTGVNLEFKNINTGSSYVTITDDVASDEIDVDVNVGTSLGTVADGAHLHDSRYPQAAFTNISVSGQDTVSADSITDTLTFAEGSNITITTNATNDTITFSSTGPIASVFGRATPAIVATAGDYTAGLITNVPAGNISSTNVQAAINELDTEKSSISHTHAGTYAALSHTHTAADLTDEGEFYAKTLGNSLVDATNVIDVDISGQTEEVSPTTEFLFGWNGSNYVKIGVNNLPTASGEANTASNVGSDGVGIFNQKTGTNLEFKKVNAGSAKITVAEDTVSGAIDFDADESQFTLDNIGGVLGLAKGGTNVDLSATGGSGYVLKQDSVGGDITVGPVTVTPAGSSGEIQLNVAGATGADSKLAFNTTTKTLQVDKISEVTGGAGVTVDGVLIKDGAVDGRDVSVDGTKLDTIEANAKAAGLTLSAQDVSGGYTAVAGTALIATANDGSSVTLPASGSDTQISIYNDTGANLTIAPAGVDTINTVSSFTIADRTGVRLWIAASDTNWLTGLYYRSDTGMLAAFEAVTGRDVSADGGKLDLIEIDSGNNTVNFFDGTGSSLESALVAVFCTQGSSGEPNRVGDDTTVMPAGTDYDVSHPGDAEGYKTADSSYVAGFADYAGIIGGYDCLNNQRGGWISGSNHSTLMYNANGHSYIGGGSYNWSNAGRVAILGSTACAITGTSQYSAIVAGRESLIDDNFYSLVVGKDNVLNAGSSNLVVGTDLTVPAGHNNSMIMGQDATTPARDTLVRGGDALSDVVNSVRVWEQIQSKVTTDASGPGSMDGTMTALESGKYFSGTVRADVIAIDTATGNQAAFVGETSWAWDVDAGNGNFAGGSNSSGPNYPLSVLGTDKIGVGAVRLYMDTGRLRCQVQGKAATTINWVAKLNITSTAAASA